MRLIDGDRLEDVIEDECFNYSGESDFNVGIQNGLLIARDIVQEAPTIDAVQVVRCKDCKFNYANQIPSDDACQLCVELPISKDFFCAYGEKREDRW